MNKTSLFLALSISLMTAGCGTVRLADQARSDAIKAQSPSSSFGQIFVCRTSSSMGAAVRPTIELNGVPIAVIGRGTFSFNEISPGDHILVAKTPEHNSKLPFSIAAGEQKYFQTWISAGVFVGWGLIDNMTLEEGKKCVGEAGLVEPEPASTTATK